LVFIILYRIIKFCKGVKLTQIILHFEQAVLHYDAHRLYMFTHVCALYTSSVFVQGAAKLDKEGAVLCGSSSSSRYVVVGLWFCCVAFVKRVTLTIEREKYRKFQSDGSPEP
jgi:hypothetical protein